MPAPARSAAGSIHTATGIAPANTGAKAAVLTLALRALDGTTPASGHGTLAGGAHTAGFVQQLKEIAPDFNLPAGFDASTGFGPLGVASDQPVSALALRMTVNQRQEVLLTSAPVADLASTAPGASPYFPHLTDGGWHVTTVILLNTPDATEASTLRTFATTAPP
ncbi:MAG: hypothetical protein HXY20_06510 [Acidobacteria bacterium]|nr:hypothetical protein [Acidobacteriota bacterium]